MDDEKKEESRPLSEVTLGEACSAFTSGIGHGIDTCICKVEDARKYYKEHKETIDFIGKITGISGAAIFARVFFGAPPGPSNMRNSTYDEKRRRFYDKRLGRTSFARRWPTRDEELEIEARYMAGESYRHILYDMGLLA